MAAALSQLSTNRKYVVFEFLRAGARAGESLAAARRRRRAAAPRDAFPHR